MMHGWSERLAFRKIASRRRFAPNTRHPRPDPMNMVSGPSTRLHNAPVSEGEDPVGKQLGLGLVCSGNYRATLPMEVGQTAKNGSSVFRIEISCGFVSQDDLGMNQNCSGYSSPLSLPDTQLGRHVKRSFFHP